MRESWERQWKSWIVTTDSVEDQRKPGKLKRKTNIKYQKYKSLLEEFAFKKGEFIALSPKCYIAYNEDDNSTKLGSKGVPHSIRLELENFRDKLYGDVTKEVELQSLRLVNNQMKRIKQRKNALNDFFTKFHVMNDRITCKPLKKNDEYL